MNTKRRDELMERLSRPKKKLGVAIVDDLAKEYREQIKFEIDVVICDFSINDAHGRSFEEFDIIFFDASYEQDGESTIDILEKLIQRKPEFREKCKVLIGEDIIEWGRHNDPKTKELIARVKSLPNIVYGNERGSKMDLIIKYIEQVGRKKDIEVAKKAPQGICRQEVLQAIGPYLEQIEKNLNEQVELGVNIRKALKGIEPTSEYERKIIEHAQGVAGLLKDNRHIINQEYLWLCCFYDKGKESRVENGANEEEHEGK